MDNATRNLSPSQETAGKIFEIIRHLDSPGVDHEGMIGLSNWNPEFYDLLYGKDRQSLSEEAREALNDKYRAEYKRDCLQLGQESEDDERWSDELDYTKAKLRGIVEGHITSGDGDLGRDLEKLANKLAILAFHDEGIALSESVNPPAGKKTISPEIANLNMRTFKQLYNLVIEGASQGLFTSGQSLEPTREKSMAEKYATPRKMVAGDIGIRD